jgi:hypothetical protein
VARARKPAAGGIPGAGRIAEPSLHDLARDQLSVFVYVALLPDETREIVRELGLSVPGFRTEALGDVERCDLVADEIRANPAAARWVLGALTKAFEQPPLRGLPLTPEGAADLLHVCSGDSALALSLWRVLCDRDRAVRDAARPVLDWLAQEYYGPRQEGEEAGAEPPPREGPDPSKRLRELERVVERANARAEEARLKAEAQRDKLQAQLKEARAREAQAVEEAARAREAAEAARRELARTDAALAAAQSADAAQEAQRARAFARDLEGRVAALEGRLERSQERERDLGARLEEAERARLEPRPQRAADPGKEGAEAEPEEAMATWLMPIYTREFYDSLEGWDRRIQRAAFKQAHLLAQDHRHPSLRALPLEGLPGYYRVRVATDVRLIYRRGERQNGVEILSLIDREDLDRYIKQAKTRG